MSKIFLLLGFLMVDCFAMKGQDTTSIISKVKIISADDLEDSVAIATIKEAIRSGNGEAAFNIFCILGPRLWDKYKQDEVLKKIKQGNVDFKVPQFDKYGDYTGMGIIKGKIIQSKDDFKRLWHLVSTDLKSDDMVVIPAKDFTNKDLFHHWLLFAEKLEEPVFIIQSNGKRLLFKTVTNSKLFCIEDMTF